MLALIVFFVAFLLLAFCRIPVGFAIIGGGMIGYAIGGINMASIPSALFAGLDSFPLLAIPAFILSGDLMAQGGISSAIMNFFRAVFSRIRGSMGAVLVFTCMLFGAICGSSVATVSAIGGIMLPEMAKSGYDKRYTTALISAAGFLGILIPPSMMLVLMGSYAQVSVGQLFSAALVPGLALSACYVIYILVQCNRHPDWGPGMSEEEANALTWGIKLRNCAINLIPPLILIVAVLGSIFTGWATPTEASSVGAFAAMILCVCYRKFTLEMLHNAVLDTAKTTAMCFVIVFGANAFSSAFLGMGGAELVTDIVNALGLSGMGVFAVMLVIAFILGCFIDWIGIVMILFPIFLPILDTYGFDRLYVVATCAVLLQTCFLTPPFGFSLFYLNGLKLPGVTLGHIYKGIIPFVIIIVFITALCVLFPNVMYALAYSGQVAA